MNSKHSNSKFELLCLPLTASDLDDEKAGNQIKWGRLNTRLANVFYKVLTAIWLVVLEVLVGQAF